MPDFINGLIAGIMSSIISLIIGKLTESLGTYGIIVFVLLNAFSIFLFIEGISDMDYWGSRSGGT